MVWNPNTDPLIQAGHETENQFASESTPPPPPVRRRTPTWKIVLIALTLVGLMFAGIVGLVLWGFSMFRSSDVYVGAMQQLRANPEAVAILGEPIEDDWLPNGSINISGPSGNADLAIGVSGPKANGTLYLVATKKAGQWTYETLTLEANGKRTNLLKEP
jgi:hypothetical protein